MAVPAMAWLWIFRSGAQSPQRQQPARRQTHEFSWWKGGVTMRGCPSTGSGVPCCARLLPRLSRATTPARRERGYLANDLGRRDTRSDRLTEQREKTVGVLLLLRSDRVTETDANLL